MVLPALTTNRVEYKCACPLLPLSFSFNLYVILWDNVRWVCCPFLWCLFSIITFIKTLLTAHSKAAGTDCAHHRAAPYDDLLVSMSFVLTVIQNCVWPDECVKHLNRLQARKALYSVTDHSCVFMSTSTENNSVKSLSSCWRNLTHNPDVISSPSSLFSLNILYRCRKREIGDAPTTGPPPLLSKLHKWQYHWNHASILA